MGGKRQRSHKGHKLDEIALLEPPQKHRKGKVARWASFLLNVAHARNIESGDKTSQSSEGENGEEAQPLGKLSGQVEKDSCEDHAADAYEPEHSGAPSEVLPSFASRDVIGHQTAPGRPGYRPADANSKEE